MKMALTILCLLLAHVYAWDALKSYSASDLGSNATSADFFRDNSVILVGSSSGSLSSYSTSSPFGQLKTVQLSGSITDVKTNPNQQLAAVCSSKMLYIITIPQLSIQSSSAFPSGSTCADVEWSPDGSKLYAVGSASTTTNGTSNSTNSTSTSTDYYTYTDFSDLSKYTTVETSFADGSGITDAKVSPGGSLLILTGPTLDEQTASSNVQIYRTSSDKLISSLDVPSTISSLTRRVEFSTRDNQIAVFAPGSRYLYTYTQNVNGDYVLAKSLILGSNIVDGQYYENGVFAVTRNNGSGSVIDFISLTDSAGSNIVVNEQIVTDKTSPNFLRFSKNYKFAALGYTTNGLNLYTKSSDKSSFAAIIAAVVGCVVVGSIGAVTVASTAAGAAGGQAAGLIGTVPVGQGTTGALNVGGGMLQKHLF